MKTENLKIHSFLAGTSGRERSAFSCQNTRQPLYIRLSYTDDRSSESDSVTNQRKLIENFIERNPDIEIISEKIDDGLQRYHF